MGGVTRSPTTNLLGTRILILIPLLSMVFMYCVCIADTRAVPRSSSRSFRFPSSNEEHGTFKDSSTLLLTKRTRENDTRHHVENNHGRNAIITLDSNPHKASVPESPGKSAENGRDSKLLEEPLSSEIIEGDLTTSEDDDEFNHDEGKNVYEDEVLREALCPPNASSSNASASLNRHESGSVIPTVNSNKLRYDLRAGKCAEIGKREHCGENMIFVAEIDSAAYGYCECDFENKILRKEAKQTALLTKTPLVFHPRTNACYRLYEQAYCNEGEWLVLSRKEKGPICEQSRCPSTSEGQEKVADFSGARAATYRRRASKLLTPSFWADNFTTTVATATQVNGAAKVGREENSVWVPLNGSGPCVKLFERNSEYCGEEEHVIFNVGDVVPKCGIVGRAIEGRAIIRNACPPGSYYSIIGRCQPDWDF